MIRIETPSGKPGTIRATDESGNLIPGILSVSILPLTESKPVVAMVELRLGGLDVLAHPLLTLENLTEAAAHHGMQLVPVVADTSKPKGK